MSKMKISVQLYTLRELTDRDMAAALRDVAKVGYRHVELAGYGSLKTAKDVRKAMDDAGVRPSGAHVALDLLERDLDGTLDDQDVLGNKIVIVPYLPENRRDLAAFEQVAKSIAHIADVAVARGFEVAYHNHDFEFKDLGGGTNGMDVIFGSTDPNKVKAEIDVFWVKRGGEDPAAYIRKFGGRTRIVHLKDMTPGEPKFAEVGSGILDIKGILAAANEVGAEFGVVEQDSTYGAPPLEAVRKSYNYLKSIGAAG